jgi:hypothetical protein
MIQMNIDSLDMSACAVRIKLSLNLDSNVSINSFYMQDYHTRNYLYSAVFTIICIIQYLCTNSLYN